MSTEAAPAESKTILIVDDHPMLRRGLAALIESESVLTVCGEAASCAAALEAIRTYSPDLVIVDLALDGGDGLDLIKAMKARHPEIPALVLSMYDEAVYAERALRAGARGYVTKQQLASTVLSAIHRLLAGQMYLSDKLEAQLAAKYVGGRTLVTDSPEYALSDRELLVFRMIGQGRSRRQVADALHLSIKTIESHCDHIKQKLRLESAVELAHRATQWVETGQIDSNSSTGPSG
jgi:DNA-binding NarL/FixJ family response regulator